MTRNSISIATVYSSAQCILSVVGSIGVILLFAGIPQLIYSPVVSAANLVTFVMGAVLIMTMVAGNTFLNYKFRRLDRDADREGTGQSGSDVSAERAGDPEDKPPSYDAILTLDGPPPEYASIMPQKPPKYEEIVKDTYTACGPSDAAAPPSGLGTPPPPLQPRGEGSPAPRTHKKILTFNRIKEEITENEIDTDQSDKRETATRRPRPQGEEEEEEQEEEEQARGETTYLSLPRRDKHCVLSEAAHTHTHTHTQLLGESET